MTPADANAPATGPKPTVGRIVHVFDYRFSEGKQPLAAIVTAVLGGEGSASPINVALFTPTGGHMAMRAVPPQTSPDQILNAQLPAIWAWPERV